MVIESKKIIVHQTIHEVFDFLKDTNNIFELMPQDKISDWKSDETSCSFKVQGGIIISFVQAETTNPTRILLRSGEKAPFPFTLTVNLEEKDGHHTKGFMRFEGEVNMFLKMMIQNPLENLFNFMSEKLRERYAK
ncbi:MAG: hypothetical protein ACO1O6_09870 [Bacteroidota bacterium]